MDSVTDSVAVDHLYVGEQPVKRSKGITIAESQTLTRGAAIGKIKFGAVTADGTGNTGNGTCTALAILPGSVEPKVGEYNLECTVAASEGGTFKLEDPDGKLVTAQLVMTAGAGAATIFEAGGLTFTLTDGGTDFIVGDKFAVTVAAGSGQGKLLDKDAVDGSSEIEGILTEDVTTGAAETQSAPIDLVGKFNTNVVTFASGTAYTDIEEDARLKGIYFGGTNY